MADIDTLLDQLAQRMQGDCIRMKRWRIIHRGNAVFFNLTTIVAPAVLAVGLTSSETLLGKCLLLAVAVVGGLNVTFKPYLHSRRRRSDMNTMRRLNDEFLAARVACSESKSDQLAVFMKYSAEYHVLYEKRADGLIESAVVVDGDAEDGGSENKLPSSKADV